MADPLPVAGAAGDVAVTQQARTERETLKVFLRLKPFTAEDLQAGENQSVLTPLNGHEVLLCPPKMSKAFKVRWSFSDSFYCCFAVYEAFIVR